eukprot:8312851-Ditylum_brightwellii.AAC.1
MPTGSLKSSPALTKFEIWLSFFENGAHSNPNEGFIDTTPDSGKFIEDLLQNLQFWADPGQALAK